MTRIKEGEISAIIRGEVVDVEYIKSGRMVAKTISAPDFAKAMNSSAPDTAYTNFFNFGTRFVARKESTVFVGVEFPEHVGQYSHVNIRQPIQTVYPNALVIVRASVTAKGHFQYVGVEVFAVKSMITGGESALYDWPGSNVNPQGNVCMGRTNFATQPTIKKLSDIAHTFFLTTNNDDMSRNRFQAINGITHPMKLFQSLEVKAGEAPKPFPYECLNYNSNLSAYFTSKGMKFDE
jgi:hypothetical protein